MENRQLSAEGFSQLQQGINLLLSRWSALQMAVDNEWGGRDTRLRSQQLAVDILSLLNRRKEPVYIDDVENMLDDFMDSLLHTWIEDGSIEEISEKLMVMHEECLEGNFTSIERLKETNPPRAVVPHIKQDDESDDTSSSGDDDDSSEMAVDGGPEPETNLNQMDEDQPNRADGTTAEAEDGWTVVPSRRNRGTRT